MDVQPRTLNAELLNLG